MQRVVAEAIQRAAISLERKHDVHGRNGLGFAMLGVGHGVTDDVLEEHLQDTTGLLIHQPRDALDTPATCETTNRWLGDALNVVSEDCTMPLAATLSEPLATFATAVTTTSVLRFFSAKRNAAATARSKSRVCRADSSCILS